MPSSSPTSFQKEIYTLLKQVPAGYVTTYKALAEAAGTKAYRAVGTIMKNNPYAPEVPCHRVVKSDGSIGGYKGQTEMGAEVSEKIVRLRQEGVQVTGGTIQDFEEKLFTFSSK